MKEKFARFMVGRYGADQFTKFLSTAAIVFLAISLFLDGTLKDAFYVMALATLFYTYFRTFSRKIENRRQENTAFLAKTVGIRKALKLRRDMWTQRKNYKFFKCPSCKTVLRVPVGKGKIRVVCRKCGNAFERRT